MQNIFQVGGGVSAIDIPREISLQAARIYQFTRGGIFDLPETFLPANAVRVVGIDGFEDPGRAGQGK